MPRKLRVSLENAVCWGVITSSIHSIRAGFVKRSRKSHIASIPACNSNFCHGVELWNDSVQIKKWTFERKGYQLEWEEGMIIIRVTSLYIYTESIRKGEVVYSTETHCVESRGRLCCGGRDVIDGRIAGNIIHRWCRLTFSIHSWRAYEIPGQRKAQWHIREWKKLSAW